MKKLMLGLMMAFAATAEAAVTIDGFKYDLNTGNKTASLTGYEGSPTKIDVAEVEWAGKKYTVTSVKEKVFYNCGSLTSVSLPNATTIGVAAFDGCEALTSLSLPNATTIGQGAFDGCEALTSLSLPNATTIGVGAFLSCSSLTLVSLPNATTIGADAFDMCEALTSLSLPNATTIGAEAFRACIKLETVVLNWELLASQDREGWALRNEAKIVGPFTEDEIKNATYKVAAVAGEKLIDKENYEKGCAAYGIAPKTEPQVVKEGEIAVTKESIQAAKAETVEIVGGMVYLGVSVLSNSDVTASTAWTPVKFTEDTQIGLSADGTKLILPIPVAAQQGFMILQSGDAKAVPSDIMTDDGSNSWSHIVIKLKDILGIHKEVDPETLTIVGLNVDAAQNRVLLKVGAETTANVDAAVANFLNVTVRKGAEVTVKVEHAESPNGPWTELQGVGGTVTVDGAGADIEVKLTGELPAQGYFRAKVEE